MAAHFIYQFVLCAIQSIIVFVIFYLNVKDNAGFEGAPLQYLITIFLVMYASDAMAFVLSSAVPTPIVAMTLMPLLLLIQLVLAGGLFELEGSADLVANFTISKWGMSAFGMIGDITQIPSAFYSEGGAFPRTLGISSSDNEMFGTSGDGSVAMCWLYFIIFIVAFYFLSVMALKLTTRKMKK